MTKKIIIAVIILVIVATSGCMAKDKGRITYIDNETNEQVTIPNKNSAASYTDDKIDNDIVEEINALDKKVIDSIVGKDIEAILGMMDESLETDQEAVLLNLNAYSDIMTVNKYDILNRYYFITRNIPESSQVVATSQNEEYDVVVDSIDGEVFVSLLSYTIGHVEQLLIIEYHRKDSEWLIHNMGLYKYSYSNNNAVYHYEKAKELYDAGEYLMAYLHIYTSSDLAINLPNFRYKNIDDIASLGQKCIVEISQLYPLPIEFDDIEGVNVYGFTPVNDVEGMTPIFTYTTSYDIDKENFEQISAEAHLIHEEIMKAFPEIKENFDEVSYVAVSNPGGVGPAHREIIEIEK